MICLCTKLKEQLMRTYRVVFNELANVFSASLAPRAERQQNKGQRTENVASAQAKGLCGTRCPRSPGAIIQKAHFPWLPAAECVRLTS